MKRREKEIEFLHVCILEEKQKHKKKCSKIRDYEEKATKMVTRHTKDNQSWRCSVEHGH